MGPGHLRPPDVVAAGRDARAPGVPTGDQSPASEGDAAAASTEGGMPAAPAVEPGDDGEEQLSAPRLPPESIQTLVRWNLGRFRACYQDALVRFPALEGRVAIRFVVAAEGSVRDAIVAASDVPEPVSWCILSAFRQLRFPPTENGTITVVYPFRLTRTGLVDAGAASRPNAPTPRAPGAAGSTSSQAPPRARARTPMDRLFALFLAGTRSPAPAGASGPRPAAGTEPASIPAPAGAGGGDASATERPSDAEAPSCRPGDPLCSDIEP